MTEPELICQVVRELDSWLVRAAGKIVSPSIQLLEKAIRGIEFNGARTLYLHVANVIQIDSRGIGALVSFYREFAAKNIEFRLLDVPPNILNTLRICNVDGLLLSPVSSADDTSVRRRRNETNWRFFEYSEQVLRALGEAVIGLDPLGKALFVNPAGEALLGEQERNLIDKPVNKIIPLEDDRSEAVANDLNPIMRALRSMDGAERAEFFLRRLNGDGRVPVAIVATPIRNGEEGVGVLVSLRDVTERREAEEALRVAGRLEVASTLAVGIAHTFNNLMVGVLGNAELLQLDFAAFPEAQTRLRDISTSAERAGELAQQMLTFSRAGRYVPRPMNLKQTILNGLKLQERFFPPAIKIHCDIASGLQNVFADPKQMGQLFMALLINAVEALRDKGEIEITAFNVEKKADGEEPKLTPGKYVCLRIRDTGEGMSPDVRRRVFEPFFTTKIMGRGLSLAAALGIVKTHLGDITVESDKDTGTVFTVWLPATDQQVRAIDQPSDARVEGGHETILVVDDEEMVMTVTKSALEYKGYHVIEARTGRDALKIVESHPTQIDLCILDLVLGEINGYELFPWFREMRPKMKIIISSGYELDEEAERLLEEGACAYLTKPYSAKSLFVEVRRALDEKDA